jgi:hypothetical protein
MTLLCTANILDVAERVVRDKHSSFFASSQVNKKSKNIETLCQFEYFLLLYLLRGAPERYYYTLLGFGLAGIFIRLS